MKENQLPQQKRLRAVLEEEMLSLGNWLQKLNEILSHIDYIFVNFKKL